jgi:hypothetical protein
MFLFSPGNLWIKNNKTFIPHPPYSPDLPPLEFVSVSPIEVKLKSCHFDTIEVVKAKM